jgi:hypothetical protein
MEEYMALSRKDLFIEISPKEIQLIQSLLTKYNPNLVTSEDDVLLDLLHKLPLLSDEDAASTATIRIALVNMWSDTHGKDSPCLGWILPVLAFNSAYTIQYRN